MEGTEKGPNAAQLQCRVLFLRGLDDRKGQRDERDAALWANVSLFCVPSSLWALMSL